jgi:peptidoglycan/LPS O-acetylase OafA/YrhL
MGEVLWMPAGLHIEVTRALEERTSGRRILAFDSLRGLAAVVVVLCHFRLALSSDPPAWFVWPLFAGRQAVTIFFVLSGYVLSLPYWNGSQLPYGSYLVRRFFRIYVPYVGAVLVAAALAWRFSNVSLPLTPWFYVTWHSPVTATLLLKHLGMGGGATLNTAFWSLRYEVEMSLIFPFLCWSLRRIGRFGGCGMALLVALVGSYGQISALTYGSCFLFGALLARDQRKVADAYRRARRYARAAFLVGSVAAFLSSYSVLIACGACGALVLCEHSRARGFFERTVPEYLGRVSFSMYLMHGTVLQLVLILCFRRMPIWELAATFFVSTLVVSHFFCVLVEETSTRVGRAITRPMTPPPQRLSESTRQIPRRI